MRASLAALALLLSLSALVDRCHAQAVQIEELQEDYKACRAMDDAGKRLDCYDALHTKLEPPSFQGAHTAETPPFTIAGPTLLRYQSDGPIFVMYLENARGDVVQNLHIGGGGEATFLIKQPGTYQLQVNGTDTWRIWLEPQMPAPANPASTKQPVSTKHDG